MSVPRSYALPPRKSKYTTVVPIDGGGIRGILSVVVLVELEDSIKRHILTEKPELLPEGVDIKTIDDFEISLADFIDCFAGTSIGAVSALYLASKGGNGRAAAILSQRSVIERHGRVVPTSAKALLVLFVEFGPVVYPPDQTPSNLLSLGTNPFSPGVFTPVFGDTNGLRQLAESVFGDIRLSELSTSCLVTAYDLIQRTQILLVYDELASPPKYGFTRQVRRNKPRSRNESFLADVQGEYGFDISIGDAAIASSSAPPLFPAHEIVYTNQPERRLLLSDGSLFAGYPTFPALVHVANSTGDTSFSRIAVLSIGAGLSVPNLTDNADGGSLQWERSAELFTFGFNLIPEYRIKQLQSLFSANPKVKPGQFLRVQTVGLPGTQLNSILTVTTESELLPQLEAVGRQTAQVYSSRIDAFVKDFIMA